MAWWVRAPSSAIASSPCTMSRIVQNVLTDISINLPQF